MMEQVTILGEWKERWDGRIEEWKNSGMEEEGQERCQKRTQNIKTERMGDTEIGGYGKRKRYGDEGMNGREVEGMGSRKEEMGGNLMQNYGKGTDVQCPKDETCSALDVCEVWRRGSMEEEKGREREEGRREKEEI